MLKRSIESPFRIIRETTCGELSASEMIAYTFTTDTFSRTGLVTAIAKIQILFFFTFHDVCSLFIRFEFFKVDNPPNSEALVSFQSKKLPDPSDI